MQHREVVRRFRFFVFGLGALSGALIQSPIHASETIDGVSITPVLTEAGFFFDDYEITVNLNVVRAVAPTTTVYFAVTLLELDPFWDNKFGPETECVAPSSWTPAAGGTFKAHLTVVFPSVSNFWGVDWAVKGSGVKQVDCPQSNGRTSGWMDQLASNDYVYRYTIENDPTGIAMNPALTIVTAQVGAFRFDFNPPIVNGDFRLASAHSPAPPIVAENGTVAYHLFFSDGTSVAGTTVGPSGVSVPALPPLGVGVLVVAALLLGAFVLRRTRA